MRTMPATIISAAAASRSQDMAHLLLCVKSRPSRRSIPARIPCRRGRPRARLYPPGSPLFGIRAAQLQLLVPGPQDNAPHAGSRNNFPLFASPHASLRLCTPCRAAGPSRPASSIPGGVLSRRQPQGSARRQAPRPGQSSTRRLVAPRSHSFCAQERRRQPRRSFLNFPEKLHSSTMRLAERS